jgi:hypothetical protein
MKRTEVLEELSIEYKRLYALTSLAKDDLEKVKEKIKALTLDADYKNDIILVKHFTVNKVDYKGMVVDSQANIPDKYRSSRQETRLTFNKQKPIEEL